MRPTLLLAAMGLALTGLFGYHAIYARQQAQQRVIQAQIAEAQSDETAQAEVAALLQRIDGYRKRLPPEPDPSWLVQQATALMNDAGLQLVSLTQEAPHTLPASAFTRLAITLQCRGNYHQLGRFIDQIEQSPSFIRVETLDISPSGDRDATPAIRMVLTTLFVPPPAAGAS